MNMLVDGEWRTDVDPTAGEDGSFQRQETSFRNRIEDDSGTRFPPEPGRYHLYVSYACPWAHRTLITRKLLDLEDAITVSVVDPFRGEDGWQFTPEKEGCTRDHVHGADYLRELYVRAAPDATGRVTVPVLWDTQENTIVNNESREIMRMLNTEMAHLGDGNATVLPSDLVDDVDRILDEIYEPINNGVYRAGFATDQEPYDEAVDDLFAALDRWDGVLADRRYLAGERLTEADVAMFTTLVRFDEVYHTHFMCNVRRITDYEHLWPYLRDLYQTSGVAETVRMDHVKEHYYTTHPGVNPHRIVARGPDPDFGAPHQRDRLAEGGPLAAAE
ncbi:glutathione S-transferase family protein [Halovivax sp.]|uniref:glutathione S-transferase family protein n=1 Tax=Halovivax sp. TaxID=1935978 RepID=UPI0025C2DB20|nr:glutathione S-transferase family protein [Halovivax sp.]